MSRATQAVPMLSRPPVRPPLQLIHPLSDRHPLPPLTRERLEHLAFLHSRTYDSYLATEDDRHYHWLPDAQGVVGYVPHGRYLHVTGGILAPPDRQAELLASFTDMVRAERRVALVCNVRPDEAPLYREHGYQLTKIGEEPLVDLRHATWRGRAFAWLRRQESYAHRQGLRVDEHDAALLRAEPDGSVSKELQAVADEHVAATIHSRELRVFVSRFDPHHLGRRRLFTAERAGRVEALLVCNPCDAGRSWAFETYRRRPDATRGVIPFLMLQTLRRLQQEGVATVSLSLIPGLNVAARHRGDYSPLRRSLDYWWCHLNWLFNLQGIHHFKTRFRPTCRNAYLAAYPSMSIPALLSCIQSWHIANISPRALARRLFL